MDWRYERAYTCKRKRTSESGFPSRNLSSARTTESSEAEREDERDGHSETETAHQREGCVEKGRRTTANESKGEPTSGRGNAGCWRAERVAAEYEGMKVRAKGATDNDDSSR